MIIRFTVAARSIAFAAVICLLQSIVSYNALAQKPRLVVQTGHSAGISCVAVSGNGKLYATGSLDNSVKLWDAATRKELRTLVGHTGRITAAKFSSDGALLATASGDSTLKLWNVFTGDVVRTFIGHRDEVTSVAFGAGDNVLASASADKDVRLWSIASDKPLQTLLGNPSSILCLAFNTNHTSLAVGCSDGAVKVLNIATKQVTRTIPAHQQPVTALQFSPDGKVLATASEDKTVKLWDAATGKSVLSLIDKNSDQTNAEQTAHDAAVTALAFGSDGKTIATGGLDKNVKIWTVTSGTIRTTLSGHTAGVMALAFGLPNADGATLVTGSSNGELKMWSAVVGKELWRLSASRTQSISSVAFSPDGATIAAGSGTQIHCWQTLKQEKFRMLPPSAVLEAVHTQPVTTVAFDRSGLLLASGSEDKTIALWDAATGFPTRKLQSHAERITGFAFSPDGTSFASLSTDDSIKLWDITSWRVKQTFRSSPKAGLQSGSQGASAHSLVFQPDGDLMAAGSWDNSARLWVPSQSAGASATVEEMTLSGHNGLVKSVAISPNGTMLASASADKTIKLWDGSTGNLLQTLTGHTAWVNGVSFSPDGVFVASASDDRTLKLWETATGKEVATLIAMNPVPEDSIRTVDWVVMTPEGRFDASEGGMKAMHVVQGIAVIPLESLFERFYTPGLLADLLEPKPEAKFETKLAPLAADEKSKSQDSSHSEVAGSKSIAATPTIEHITKNPLPIVKLLSPPAGAEFQTDAAMLTIEVRDEGSGIDEIAVFRNGTKVIGEKIGTSPMAGMMLFKTYRVELLPGKNDFRVSAFNRDRTESLPVEVSVERKGEQRGTRLFVLGVGVNQYKNPRYNLSFARADISAVVQTLAARAGSIFAQVIVDTLFDAQVTKPNLEAALKRVMDKAKPTDAFVFYFSGHGVTVETTEAQRGDFYLVTHDVTQTSDDAMLREKAFPAQALKTFLTSSSAPNKKLVIFDACESGGGVETFAMRGGMETEQAIKQLARSQGMAVIGAAEKRQTAKECKEFGHGVFTQALLEGLNGKAAAADGKVTVGRLKAWLEDKVPEYAKLCSGKEQFPMSNLYGQDFPLTVGK